MIVYIVENLWWPFGCHLLHVKWNIIKAKKLGAKLVYKHNNHKTFPDGSVQYYFQDWSDKIEVDDTVVHMHASLCTDDVIGNYLLPNDCYAYTSVAEMHSVILKNIYKPSTIMQLLIDENVFLKSLPKNHEYIAMHVRWSDKVHGTNTETVIIHLSEYMKHAVSTRETNPLIKTIVLCTDNTEAFDELKKENDKLACPFTLMYNENEERSQNNMNDAIVQKAIRNMVDQDRLVRDYENGFINFEIMINSYCIIANFDSGYCLVPVQLRNSSLDINVRNAKPLWGFS